VIIATYNRAAFLDESLRSVLNQRYRPLEILVADDGSTDETRDCVEMFQHPAIQYLHLEHSGRPSVVRNRALELAKGQFVAFLDDDDIWQPNKIERQVEALRSQPHAGFSYTDARLIHSDGVTTDPVLKPEQRLGGAIFSALLLDCFIVPSTILIRKDLLDRVGLFDETLAITEDYDLWLRLAFASRAAFVDEPLAWIRRHEGSISREREILTHQNMLTVLERLSDRQQLSLRQSVEVRRAIARARVRLGRFYLKSGVRADARRQFRTALLFNPMQRGAWKGFLSSCSRERRW
jgi:glycosyltransferase involved in cell wall biosynthesis